MSKLALLGGNPIGTKEVKSVTHWPPKHWPPRTEATANKFKALYLSNDWGFESNSEKEFAQAFADYHGAKHGIFMANGTVTLQCALAACGIGPGDEVIVPPLTWIATALAVHYVGATPVFVDVEPDTLCLDPVKVGQAITEKTKAIMPVHVYGSMADMDKLMAIAKQYNLKVIEDCAHVHGGMWDGKGIGTLGDVGSFSCQQTKTMASGEGGICITNNDQLADLIYRMSHIGYAKGTIQGQRVSAPQKGFVCHNFRPTAFQALILSEQLKDLGGLLERYNTSMDILEGRLQKSTNIRFQKPGLKSTTRSTYGWVMIFDEPCYADIPTELIQQACLAEGLTVCPVWPPTYQHEYFSLEDDKYRIDQQGCGVAEQLIPRILTLFHYALIMDEKGIHNIADIIEKVISNCDELRSYMNTKTAS